MKRNRLYIVFLLLFISVSIHGQEVYSVERVPFSSKEYDEYAPVIYNDGLIFTANKRIDMLRNYEGDKGKPPLDIFVVKKLGDNNWSRVELLADELRTITYDGPVTLNKEGDKMFFNRNIDPGNRKARNNRVGIFSAEYVNGKWINIEPFVHNNPLYNLLFPSLSPDGTRIYFSSNDPGSLGGYDLYVCSFRNGVWEAPVNLGPNVNTKGNEIYPVIHPDGRLYFSTNGIKGIGGYDIWYTEEVNGEWPRPVNLREPLNSRRNDASFISDAGYTQGFLTSNRDRRTNCIYEFKLTAPTFESCKEQEENDYCFTFFEVGTIDIDTTSYMYEWRIGDEARIQAKEANYCFSGPGNYYIQLNVIDLLTGEVLFNQAAYDLVIEDIEQVYIACPDTVMINQVINLDGTKTYLKNFEVGSYYWDLGEYTHVSIPSFTHSYYKPGIYTIRLGVISTHEKSEEPQKSCSYKTIIVLPAVPL